VLSTLAESGNPTNKHRQSTIRLVTLSFPGFSKSSPHSHPNATH